MWVYFILYTDNVHVQGVCLHEKAKAGSVVVWTEERQVEERRISTRREKDVSGTFLLGGYGTVQWCFPFRVLQKQ